MKKLTQLLMLFCVFASLTIAADAARTGRPVVVVTTTSTTTPPVSPF